MHDDEPHGRSTSGPNVERAPRLVRRSRWVGLGFIAFNLVLAAAIVAFGVVRGNQGLAEAILTNTQFVLLWGGFAVAFFFGTRAVDLHRRFCTKCRYERATSPDGEECSLERCPECGAAWNEFRGTTVGRVTWRPVVIAIGAAFAIVPMAINFGGLPLSGFAPKLTPTSMLIDETIRKQGFNVSEWAELNARTLSDEQRIALTEGLLQKRFDRGGVIMDDATWLMNAVTQDWLPENLRHRFHEDMLSVALDAPERVRIGETFRIRPDAVDRNNFITDPLATVIISGYFVGDDPLPRNRSDTAIASITIAASSMPSLSITAEEPGPLRVRLEYWLLAIDGSESQSFLVDWIDADTPALPKSVRWSERRTVERVVLVEE